MRVWLEPRDGLYKVGFVLNTRLPVPVSSEITSDRCNDDVEENCDNPSDFSATLLIFLGDVFDFRFDLSAEN
jgi:hypothetical protein